MNCVRHHITLNFIPLHINYVLVETWEYFWISSAAIAQKYFKNTHTHTLSWLDIVANRQSCLAGTQIPNRDKADEIGDIAKASIAPIDMEEFRTTDPMVILREKLRGRSPRNFLIGSVAYDTMRNRTVLTLHQIKKVGREMKRWKMIRITNSSNG